MRTVRRNKQKMKYASYLGSVEVVQTDENGNPQTYEDNDGSVYYLTTREKRDLYTDPVEFSANFSTSGGEAQEEEYGLSISDFDGVIIYALDAFPLDEGTLVWKESEVEYYKERYYTNDLMTLIEVHSPVKASADYVVKKVGNSLNYTRVNVSAINK